MVSDEIRVSELNYKIGIVNRDITNLNKMLNRRKGNNTLREDEEYTITKQLEEKAKEKMALEAQIRQIENQNIRAQNFAGR